MSAIGWVDYSSKERALVTEVLSMLKEKGTLDELGIGQMRDTFADILFPGFSTIQTRAKYLVTIGYIFQDYLELPEKVRIKTDLIEFFSKKEDEVANQLVNNHGDNVPNGIIGRESLSSGGVARKPSSVYWNALRQFDIVHAKTGFREFCKLYQQAANSKVQIHHEEDDNNPSSEIHSLIDKEAYNYNWLEDVRVPLSKDEAQYLKNKIQRSPLIRNSVPSQILINGLLSDVVEMNAKLENSDWRVNALYEWLKTTEVSDECKRILASSLDFSLVMEGAHIRYNVLIAKQMQDSELSRKIEFLEQNEQDFKQWKYDIQSNKENLFSEVNINNWFDILETHGRNINKSAREFIQEWCSKIRNGIAIDELDEFIEKRAKDNKQARCLLNKALPETQGWVGIRKLEYRWPTALAILSDIQEGLNASS
jgi:hypothetical protein